MEKEIFDPRKDPIFSCLKTYGRHEHGDLRGHSLGKLGRLWQQTRLVQMYSQMYKPSVDDADLRRQLFEKRSQEMKHESVAEIQICSFVRSSNRCKYSV